MTTKRREVLELLYRLKQGAPSRLLNDEVRKVKTAEADHINHAGFRKQLDFLIEKHGLPAVKKMVEHHLEQHRRLKKLAEVVRRKRKMAAIVHRLYQYKAGEADTLAMSDMTAQLKYILHTLGGRDVLKALLGEEALGEL